jgi:hypothetical protein
MKSTYALIRQIHLFAGLVLAIAVLFYTVSGMTFVYAPWLPRQQTVTTTTELALPAEAQASESALRAFVAQRAATTGRTKGLESEPSGAMRQRWITPSSRVDAEVSADHRTLTINRTQLDALGTVRSFHVLRGGDGGIGYLAWRILLDLVSLSMLVFAVTGFLLWYRSTKDRRLGWVLFAGSWAYTLGLVAYLLAS